jgi:hypothetical protein
MDLLAKQISFIKGDLKDQADSQLDSEYILTSLSTPNNHLYNTYFH